jgi:isochorismate synthase
MRHASRPLERSGSTDGPKVAVPAPALVTLEQFAQPLVGLLSGPSPDVEVAWCAPDGVRWWGLGRAYELSSDLAEDARLLPDRARAFLKRIAPTTSGAQLLRCFGGVAFDPSEPGAWPAAAFWLPACLVRLDDTGVDVAITTVRRPDETEASLVRRHAKEVQAYRARLVAPPVAGAWVVGKPRENQPSRTLWDDGVEEALAAIAHGTFEKVVLAHGATLDFATPPDLARAFEGLAATAPGTDRLCLRPRPGLAVLAASPEVLFNQAGEALLVDCLAGTALRGADSVDDRRLADALLSNEKERHEHEVVVAFVRDALVPHVLELELPAEPGLRRLATLQHLHTPISATIPTETPLSRWLELLHPTPAVCGQPREASRRFVRDLEVASRGWYAGALGWVAVDEARFVVGLRAALFQDLQAWVPAGAGIVKGSTPANEWAETRRKAAPMLALLTGDEP